MDRAIFQHFQNHIETAMAVGESCTESLSDAAYKLSQALLAGSSIFSCGQGHSLNLSSLFVEHLTGGYKIERPGFPAMDLEAIAARERDSECYAKALQLFAKAGDVLWVFDLDQHTQVLEKTVAAASDKEVSIILLSAANDRRLSSQLSDSDTEIVITADKGPDAIAAGLLILQCLCGLIDKQIFGGD